MTTREDWICTNCRTINSVFRQKCRACGQTPLGTSSPVDDAPRDGTPFLALVRIGIEDTDRVTLEWHEVRWNPRPDGLIGGMTFWSSENGATRYGADSFEGWMPLPERLAPPLKTPLAQWATIYLMAGLDAWPHKVPASWKEAAAERFDYIECRIYQKRLADLTETDVRDWLTSYAEKRPAGWIEPRPVRRD